MKMKLDFISITSLHFLAPPNCLQYHLGIQGNIRSFNYEELSQQAVVGYGLYLNNLDYTICFRKQPGFCTITYSVPNDLNFNQQNQLPNQEVSGYQPGLYFNVVADPTGPNAVGTDQAGAGPYECNTDYLILANIRLCGFRLNPQLYPQIPNPSMHAEVFGMIHNYLVLAYRIRGPNT